MPITTTRFSDLAAALLAALEAEYAARIPDLEGLTMPERRFTTTGPVALDLRDCLAVSLVRVYSGLPSAGVDDGRRIGELTLTAELRAVAVRCIPTQHVEGQTIFVPTEEELIAASVLTSADAVILSEGIRQAILAGLFEPCTEVAMLDTTAMDNSGGLGGWETVVRVQV